jgi:hypothetical protein
MIVEKKKTAVMMHEMVKTKKNKNSGEMRRWM